MLIFLAAVLVFLAIVVLVIGLTQERPHPMTARIAGESSARPW